MRPPLSRFLVVSLLMLTVCGLVTTGLVGCSTGNRETENLTAFGRLYGYLRFFHPSDAAAELDWESFALLGAERVRTAENPTQLQAILEDLIHPFAPLVQVFPVDTDPDPLPREELTGVPVAWQHRGVRLSPETRDIYLSVRTGRNRPNEGNIPDHGMVTQCMPASLFRGKKVRLTGLVRAEVSNPGSGGHLWLRVDRPDNQVGFFDNMFDRPVTSDQWQRYEVVGDVAEDAERLCFGCMLIGEGSVWGDGLTIETGSDETSWRPMPVYNEGFEMARDGEPRGWNVTAERYVITLDDENPGAQERSLYITSDRSTGDRIFAQLPVPGATVSGPIGGGLACRVPLILTSAEAQRTGDGLADLKQALQQRAAAPSETSDPVVRQAGLIIAWNVFQHFYPYFDVVDVDWLAVLPDYLDRVTAAADEDAYVEVMSHLVGLLQDGHAYVVGRSTADQAPPDFLVDWIEDQVVVVWAPDGSPVQPGDIVVSVDGQDARDLFDHELDLSSGSQQWRRKRAARRFGLGPKGSTAEVVVRRPSGQQTVAVQRVRDLWLNHSSDLPDLTEIEPDIWYVNLDRAEMELIRPRLEDLASARGVIFDLRGYPRGNHEILNHLLAAPDTSRSWMQFPEFIYPDQHEMSWQPLGWRMQPREPHIGGRIVFLTDGRAISYAESVLGYVENYHLGEIVGGPTAGANGNVNPFTLPGGLRVAWTGMRVVKHDGRQQHLVGITPTVPVTLTVQDLREGRDPYVDKALAIIKGE